jgi:hypothetical protein
VASSRDQPTAAAAALAFPVSVYVGGVQLGTLLDQAYSPFGWRFLVRTPDGSVVDVNATVCTLNPPL